jgi:hypothetical protein
VYGALQATLFGWVALTYGWFWVFGLMALTRFLALVIIWRVKA